MKIDTIYHSVNERRQQRKGDPSLRKYNKDPIYHPMMLQREYVRALNSAKLERMFAKPFIASFGLKGEGIWCLSKDANSSRFASVSYDNKITVWDISTRSLLDSYNFDKKIEAISYDSSAGLFVAQDTCVLNNSTTFKTTHLVSSLDYLSSQNLLAVGNSKGVHLFGVDRHTPRFVYEKNAVNKVKLNPSFIHTMGIATSHEIVLYDNRVGKEYESINISGINSMEFNPQKGYIFAVGCENASTLIYDMRDLSQQLNILRGHVGPVVSMSFSPNGSEIATGSFDHTIRIFGVENRKSRDCYYNDRMQIVHGLAYSNDGRFIVSGSDDGSLRLWKAQASGKVGPISKHEKEKLKYRETLKEKFKDTAEIARMTKHRFLPKELKHKMRTQHEAYEASLRRAEKMEETKTTKQFYDL